ncbi:ABC transporter ATP-binding protein [Paenibacillus kribbensis]|uniref:ABC transporter ATP-binding protein n=1 Tax=Paenibacillus kribbensis TaxID=172713 RepID=UPI0008398B92|nr:ATP-binding cassette domain-containing protein [Paenibacillus kribbensis]
MGEMIRTEGLTKVYDGRTILDHVSLSVNRGEIYGFLGLNGAGKTTTIRTLLGMIKPTSGEVYLLGKKLTKGGNLWNHVGYMVEVPYAYSGFTVRENLKLYAKMRGIKDRYAVDSVIEKVNLGTYAETKAKNLSLGNAQKLGLAKALIHNPEILILDEPTNALDPAGIVGIRELLKSLSSEGVTIFISSHILEEMSKLASRIGIIHRGVLLQEISALEFENLRRKRLYVGVRGAAELARERLTNEGYEVSLSGDGILELSDHEAVQYPERVSRLLADADIPLYLLRVEEEELESYFLNMVGSNPSKELK